MGTPQALGSCLRLFFSYPVQTGIPLLVWYFDVLESSSRVLVTAPTTTNTTITTTDTPTATPQ